MSRAWLRSLLVVFLVFPSFGSAAEQVKLRITLQLPITHHLGVNLMQFKQEVESKSGGAISVEIFDNSRLYKDYEVLQAVASGAIEIGDLPTTQFHKRAPALALFEQPFLFNFEALVKAGTDPDGKVRQLLDAAVLEATGVRILWWQAYGQSVLFSKGGRHTKSPADIRGQKVRTFGENMANFINYCGGKGLVISASKQHQALKDGTVDVVMTGITGVTGRELWKVSDTITITDHAALEFSVVINEKVWQALSPEHKAIVTAAARKAERDLRQKMADIEADAYAFARQKGMTVHELTPNEVAEWRACSANIMDDFMNNSGDLARRLMEAYGKLRTDPCCTAGPKGEFTHR